MHQNETQTPPKPYQLFFSQFLHKKRESSSSSFPFNGLPNRRQLMEIFRFFLNQNVLVRFFMERNNNNNSGKKLSTQGVPSKI